MKDPIYFKPIAKERLWGGRHFERLSNKNLPPEVPIGELWELVDREYAQSIASNGEFSGKTLHDLWAHQRESVFGACYQSHPAARFPILVKLLDASDKLSIQVHPPAHMADHLGGEAKTEVWYFLESSNDASIYAGLKRGVTREEFQNLLDSGEVEGALHKIPVHTGESIFIPSGRLHGIGGGNMIIEIQQNSDTTYRVYDWNRTGRNGKPRELHIKESMQSINFEDFEPRVKPAGNGIIADCEYFHVEKTTISAAQEIRPSGRFALAVSTDHPVLSGSRVFSKGEFFLLPADEKSFKVSPVGNPASILMVTLPPI